MGNKGLQTSCDLGTPVNFIISLVEHFSLLSMSFTTVEVITFYDHLYQRFVYFNIPRQHRKNMASL